MSLTREALLQQQQQQHKYTQRDIALASTSKGQDVLTNWSGVNVLGSQSAVRRPQSLAELSQLVVEHRHVRPIGSCLSYEPIARAADTAVSNQQSVLVDLSAFAGLRSYDQDTRVATFGAATTVEQVVDALEKRGRAIDCSPGVIGIQTLAGAIATGTHGQGLCQNSLSETVVGVEIVLADGSVKWFDDRTDKALMRALRISMGLCGIITAVALRTSPLRVFTLEKHDLTFDDFFSQFEQFNRTREFCKAWWFPNSHVVHVWTADQASDADLAAYAANGKQPTPVPATSSSPSSSSSSSSTPSKNTSLLADSIRDMASKMEHDTADKKRLGRQFETVGRFNDGINRIGTLRQLYMRGIPVPQINCELALPLSQFQPAIAALMEWCDSTRHELHYPFIFRCAGAGSSYLSPHPGQPIVWIGFLVYLAADGTAKPGSFEMMREIQQVLAPLGAAPHWGKHFVPEIFASSWSRSVPGLDQFRHTVVRLDPKGKWRNDFTERVFSLDSLRNPRLSSSHRSSVYTRSEPLYAKQRLSAHL
ncbi:D-arabinono-1,4-lactone oxidase [Sorochytrium milnesiophthora]